MSEDSFRQAVWNFYRHNGRHDLPWRKPDKNGDFDPYKIMVSEIMLQQTQVPRVIPKYTEFLRRFATAQDLANAELGDVLRAWSGLGYNRRAKYLHQAARFIMRDNEGIFPKDMNNLVRLPGVGVNTAGAILAYSYNAPTIFIETNIRTVYIHHYFNDQTNIEDKQILSMLRITLDKDNPREWYWALMDYGAYLKKSGIKRNLQSKHYVKQSKFEGSKRQVRGEVLRQLSAKQQTLKQLSVNIPDKRLTSVVDDLLQEGLIRKTGNSFRL